MKARVLTIVLCGVILLAGSATQGQREPKGEPGMFPGAAIPGGFPGQAPGMFIPGGAPPAMMGGMGGMGGAAMRIPVQMQALLAINNSPAVFELNGDLVEALVNSPFVLNQDVWAGGVERIDAQIMVSQKDNQSLLKLQIYYSAESAFAENAKQYVAEIAKLLERTLAKEYDRRIDRLDQARGFAEEQREKATEELTILQNHERELREAAGQSDLSREFILNKTRDLEQDREEMRMGLASSNARRVAIQDQIAKIGEESLKRVSADPIAEELEEIVKICERRVITVSKLMEEGRASGSESDDAREKLAKARIELITRREAVKSSVGGEEMAKWNNELIALAITAADDESNLGFVERQLHDIKEKGLWELADRYEVEVAVKMPAVRERLMRATERAEELKRKIEEKPIYPLRVVLLGAEEEPEEGSSEPDGG
jgi:citrate lyase gamma subunit